MLVQNFVSHEYFWQEMTQSDLYFKKKIISNENLLCNNNKQMSMSITELYEIIFAKMNILS